MRLYSGPLSMFGAKAEIAIREKGLPFELVMVPFDMDRLYEPKHPEVVRINPKRQVPVLVHGDLEIFDSTQIFEYFEDLAPEPPLWPAGAGARARGRLLELTADEVFFPPVIRLMGLQDRPNDPAAVEARAACARIYRAFEAHLAGGDHLAGPYTYVDIAFYMAQVFATRMGAAMTAETPRLLAWRERVGARPSVRAVIAPMGAFLHTQGRPLPDFMAEAFASSPRTGTTAMS
jgi:glutathione S-transferase